MTNRILAVAVLAAALASCAGPETPAASDEATQADTAPADAAQAARAAADLGWAALSAGAEPNRVVSPSSFAATLAMVAEGATGETLDLLNELFGLDEAHRAISFQALRSTLADYEGVPDTVDPHDPPPAPVVHQASHLAVVEGQVINGEFLTRVSDHFAADHSAVPRPKLKAALDAWVAHHTADLIDQSAVEVNDSLAFVVQDAVLFAAAWREAFTSTAVPLTFHAPTGAQEISALGGEFTLAHASTEQWEAIRLPYDENLAMDLILPAEGLTPGDLDADDLEAARAALDDGAHRAVRLTMPAVDLAAGTDLLGVLEEMGVSFAGGLEGIFPGADLGALVQQARLTVTAQGTVGAAVTEAAVITSAPAGPGPHVVQVDRPYVLRVLDTRTGWPLFLASIADAEAAQP